jgi:hypothetical protein
MISMNEIKMINIVKDYGVCFVFVERDFEEIDFFSFEREIYISKLLSKLLLSFFTAFLYL